MKLPARHRSEMSEVPSPGSLARAQGGPADSARESGVPGLPPPDTRTRGGRRGGRHVPAESSSSTLTVRAVSG